MTHILVLNLGSTSSKIAIFDNETCIKREEISHDQALTSLPLEEQITVRRQNIEDFIALGTKDEIQLDVISCRGGLLRPISGGVYHIDTQMYDDLKSFKYGVHASNLSGVIGYQLAQDLNVPVYTVDPVVVDELIEVARVTGLKGIERKSIFHALNQKAVARQYAKDAQTTYTSINVIVAHMGGGITVGAHERGDVIDVNDGLLGEGPMSPERAGSIPNDLLYAFGYEQQLTPKEMAHALSKAGGFISLLGTNDLKSLAATYDSDPKVKLAFDALAYQVAKTIGERAVSLKGQVDQIILTGGLSHNATLVQNITEYVSWIADVTVYAGEREMDTLAHRANEVMHGNEDAKWYR